MASGFSLMDKERKSAQKLSNTLTVVSASGFATFLLDQQFIWQQWTYLAHCLISIYLTAPLAFYLLYHLKRTYVQRRPFHLCSGVLTASVLLVLFLSGWHIIFFGQYETARWVYQVHIVSAVVFILLILIHLPFYRLLKTGDKTWSQTLSRGVLKSSLVSVLVATSGVGLASILYQQLDLNVTRQAASQPYALPFGDVPFLPSQANTTTGGFLTESAVGRSDRCEACHKDITKQWRASMHAGSATDYAFQTNVNSLADAKGIEATRYCFGCHGPVALLTGQTGGNGNIGSGSHIEEGISCMGCHGIAKAIHLKGAGSYLFEPQKEYLFGQYDEPLLTTLNHFLINVNPRQHRADMARDILQNPKNCATCHVQYIDQDLNDWGWVKLQDQYHVWLDGPFSGQNGQVFSHQEPMRCQDCHFPLVVSKDPSADQEGKVRSHRTPAANTAIPWLKGDVEQYEVEKAFLQNERLKVSIRTEEDKAKHQVTAHVAVTSLQIGHRFPAGTVDLNEAWIHFLAEDGNGTIIYESGAIQSDNSVDPDAHFYYSMPVDRQGNRVWKHDLFNVVGDNYENLIPPGGSDNHSYHFDVPKHVKGPIKMTARVRYRKFNDAYARWALKSRYRPLPVVDMAEIKTAVLW